MGRDENVSEFTETWHRDAPRVAAYTRRHVAPSQVQDVVAETFLQAWRRWPEVPDPALPWLLGTARKVLANHRRGQGRREALRERLILLDGAARSAHDADLVAIERMDALEVLAGLPEDQREALLLVAWDGLSPEQAATTLGIRPGTFRVRTHRARRAARQALDRVEAPTRLTRISGPALVEGESE